MWHLGERLQACCWCTAIKREHVLCAPPPFAPCSKSFDLGQFERFRRIMHIPAYRPLLNHEEVMTLSTLQVSQPQSCRVGKVVSFVSQAAFSSMVLGDLMQHQRLALLHMGWSSIQKVLPVRWCSIPRLLLCKCALAATLPCVVPAAAVGEDVPHPAACDWGVPQGRGRL